MLNCAIYKAGEMSPYPTVVSVMKSKIQRIKQVRQPNFFFQAIKCIAKL